jgi:hypothetical protein
MSWIVVDVESDGPLPGRHSMVCFGAVLVDDKLDKTFYGQTKPISMSFQAEALAISGFSREEHEGFTDPKHVMDDFALWLKTTSKGRPVLISDNNGYDAAWINYYFHTYIGKNPFGWTSRRIGDMYCGMMKDAFASWKHLRTTKHTHHPVDDARGNAEAILKMRDMGLKIPKK